MLNIVVKKWAFSGECGLDVECGWFFVVLWDFGSCWFVDCWLRGVNFFVKKLGKNLE